MAEDPTGYWLWKQNGDAADRTTGPVDGTLNGGPISRVSGVPGTRSPAMRFDANASQTQYIDLGNTSVWNLTGSSLTATLWVRPWVSGSNFSGLITRGQNPDAFSNRTFNVNLNTTGTLTWQMFVGGANSNITSTATIRAGSWGFVAGTYDGSTGRLYVNGIQDTSASWSGAPNNPNSRNLEIGRMQGISSSNPTYDLAHVAFWNYRALTAASIARLYAAAFARRSLRRGLAA